LKCFWKLLKISWEVRMKKFKSKIMFIFLIFITCIIITGCSEDENENIQTASKSVYILNGTAQTLSVYDIENKAISNDVLPVGKWPADIKIMGDEAYVVNTGDNNVQIFDLVNMKQSGMIITGDGSGPERIGFLSENKAYVSCLNTNSVKAIDLEKNQVTGDIPAGIGPMGVAVANKKVYVCNSAYDFASSSYGKGTVSVIDSSNDMVIKTVDVGTNPLEAVTYGDKAIILCNGNYADITGKLCIIDSASDSVTKTVDLGTTPSGIAISPGGIAYITTFGGLISVDINSGTMIRKASEPLKDFAGGSGLAFSKDGTCYIVIPDWAGTGNDKLLVMDSSEKLIGTYKAGGGASIVALKE